MHLPSRTHRTSRPPQRRALLPAVCLLAASLSLASPALASEGQSVASTRDASVTAQSLADQLAGEGLSVSNATISGKDVQLGAVSGLPAHGNAVESGIALTTGSL